MTYDLVVLTANNPDIHDVVAGMKAAGPELRMRQVVDGAVVQLCDADDRTLVSVETPLYVQLPDEVPRLLGDVDVPLDTPVWWLELRAVDTDGATAVADAFAGEVARRHDGTVWAAQPLHRGEDES